MSEAPCLKAMGHLSPVVVEMDRFPFRSSTLPFPNVNVLFTLFVNMNDVPAGITTWLYAVNVLFVIAVFPANTVLLPFSANEESVAATLPVNAESAPISCVNTPLSNTISLPGADDKAEPPFNANVEPAMIRPAQMIEATKNQMNRLLAQATGKSEAEIEACTDRDTYMTPQDAKAFGLIDEVIRND